MYENISGYFSTLSQLTKDKLGGIFKKEPEKEVDRPPNSYEDGYDRFKEIKGKINSLLASASAGIHKFLILSGQMFGVAFDFLKLSASEGLKKLKDTHSNDMT